MSDFRTTLALETGRYIDPGEIRSISFDHTLLLDILTQLKWHFIPSTSNNLLSIEPGEICNNETRSWTVGPVDRPAAGRRGNAAAGRHKNGFTVLLRYIAEQMLQLLGSAFQNRGLHTHLVFVKSHRRVSHPSTRTIFWISGWQIVNKNYFCYLSTANSINRRYKYTFYYLYQF